MTSGDLRLETRSEAAQQCLLRVFNRYWRECSLLLSLDCLPLCYHEGSQFVRRIQYTQRQAEQNDEKKKSQRSDPTISEGQDSHAVKGEGKSLKSYLAQTFFACFFGTAVFMRY